MPGYLGGVCGEHRDHRHLAQRGESLLGGDSRRLQAQEGAAKGTCGRSMLAMELAGAATAFAVVGLGQVGQFEICGESLGDLVGMGKIHIRDHLLGARHLLMRFRSRTAADLLAMLDQQSPELLDRIKQFAAALLDQHLPQQCAERTHIPAQGVVLGRIFRPCREFGEAGILVFRFPQQFGLAHEGRRKRVEDRINERARVVGAGVGEVAE